MTAFLVRAVGVLLMLTALAVTLSHAPDRPVQTLVARWAPAPSDFIDVRGQVLHIRDEGPRDDPLPLLLLHGTASSLHTWEGWVRVLKTRRRVISFDLPGFGLTGPYTADPYAALDEAQRYHGDTYARFVIDVMDTLQLPRAVLAGNGLGGEVAWRTAALAPPRVAGLVLVAASGPRVTPQMAQPVLPLGFMAARVPGLGRISEHLLPRSVVAQSLAVQYGDPSVVTPALVDRYFEMSLREGNRRALQLVLQHRTNGADAARIGTLKLPALLLWGGRDRLVPPDVGRIFAQQVVGSQWVQWDDLGHVPQEEDAARTVKPVLEFLAVPGLR